MERPQGRIEFVTETGVLVPAVSSTEMLEIDRIAVDDTGPNLFQMMENAGRNLASLAVECLQGKWKRARVLVLAGPGGNGGGGICAARHLILDAIFGYRLAGPPRGAALEMILWANRTGAPILALDIPSGVDATTGETPGEFVRARWTMTLALPKTGLVPDRTGTVELADIGIPQGVYRRIGLAYCNPFDHRYRVPLTPRTS